ncbi:TnsA endonuclease N-terminal domain-containing protein [Cupriavidus basilensis]|uniref:TnsA endonuclease N-terminal domain-containing protein n=1 Tax=Cupriavidus basilensis TaxID=68895 RepID=A0A7M2GXD8_9BURK|nr:TnsA endonuclease N-terminal domain-containing protein [Cupriavidus basilensis]QOT76559.1 TnsA endonuclease N-terminal domain-containing protein [Cupriavidus basilensis]
MNCLYLAEFARTIVAFDEQPVSISYLIRGRRRRYTPDFRFVWQDGREWFVEVKPAEKLNTSENNERFAEIASHFESAGARFVALTEEQICQTHRSQLVRYLLRMRPNDWEPREWPVLSCQDHHSASFAEAAQVLGDPKKVLEALARRDLVCDLHQPLTAQTVVRPFAEADDDALFV